VTHILALDTTSRYTSVSISKDGDILFEYNFTSHNRLSSSLIPVIGFLLENAELTLNDIDAFGIAIGPGLFTGIRVGLSTLKGMLFSLKKPVVAVVTLKALAYKYINSRKKMSIFPLIDAKRDEVYMAGYTLLGQDISEVVPPCLVHINDLKKELASFNTTGCYFVGSGADVHKKLIGENFKQGKILDRSSFLAAEIGKIAYHDYLAKKVITDLQQLMPFYIRIPDAEQNYPGKIAHPLSCPK
jgi:tRNA threonylcarbamoyladenosine biosynthesis protein TsaB